MSDCDRRWELEVYREGRLGSKDAQSFERHLKICSECRLRKDCDERLLRLASSLPQDPPDELTLRRLRTRVLRDVATGVRVRQSLPWTQIAVAALLLLALGGGGLFVHHRAASGAQPVVASPAPTDAPAGTVTAGADARWSQVRRDGIETVTVDDGSVAIHVRPQRAGERFLVALPDGELEVRGTTFDVLVASGSTRAVQVQEGLVEVRIQGRSTLRLAAGEAWTAPTPVPAATSASSAALEAPPHSGTSSLPAAASSSRARPSSASVAERPSAAAADDGTYAYASAVDLLRTGRGDEAAAAFHAFLLAHPSAVQVEDASFLEAVALARAGREDAAALAAEHHLARFPSSFHRKEASILVARAASQRGDCARARTVLSPWLGASPDGDLRSALGSCPP